jgi:hypothetical protein
VSPHAPPPLVTGHEPLEVAPLEAEPLELDDGVGFDA